MAFEDFEDYRSSGLDNEKWCHIQNSDSSVDLYGELQNTAERFKELADKLQRSATKKDLKNEKGIQTIGCCEETKTKLMECIAENLRLRQSLKDVSDINHRWQDYNCDRQKHVQHLQSTVLELRRIIDDMTQQSTKLLPTTSKGSEKSETCVPSVMHFELCRTIDTIKQPSRKSSSSTKDSEKTELDKESSLNNKLSHEVRVLSRQLKDARNESKALKLQLEKLEEENDILRTSLKLYKSDWEDENRKKVEALNQAQKVVQELCALKINCQQQAERLMKMCTVSFNCSLCQETQNRQTQNNLNITSESEQGVKAEQRERHRKVARTAATIIQHIDGIEVHLQERCPGAITDKMSQKCQITAERELESLDKPIVTFPDSDSDEEIVREEPLTDRVTSQHLLCPVCKKSFLRECGSEFLDHYTTCKLPPGKSTHQS